MIQAISVSNREASPVRYSLTGKDILLHYPASLRETAVVADLASYALSEEEARGKDPGHLRSFHRRLSLSRG